MMKNKTWEKDKRAFDLLVADTILDLDAKKINKARAIGIIIFGMANLLAIKEEPLFIKDLLKKEREKMGKALRLSKDKLPKKGSEVRVKTTTPFKLKDKAKRFYKAIHLKNHFGFVPEVIIVEKVQGRTNTIIVRAIMTPESIKEENKRKEEILKKKDSLLVATPKIILPKS